MEQAYETGLRKILEDPDTRFFLQVLLIERCQIYTSGYQHNAAAYSQLAKREIGLGVLMDARQVNRDMVDLMLREYEDGTNRAKPGKEEEKPWKTKR